MLYPIQKCSQLNTAVFASQCNRPPCTATHTEECRAFSCVAFLCGPGVFKVSLSEVSRMADTVGSALRVLRTCGGADSQA
jgi:hypothetical protein